MWEAGIDTTAPGIYPATQIEDSLMTVLFEPASHLSAPNPMMADHNGVHVLWEFAQKGRTHPAHRRENAALKMIDIGFPVLAHIEQSEMCLSLT
ncbi:hypothetical protein SPICUR_00645 [Spiribacter curvatus]|uniref:Uncharacterized protein n=1 Tax=Spiribacter curvatus TaxID=1335757 RepID=U5T0X9_9GAMM|nr:hypothetical protein SPICUR_00645 [Spiribacter curvatus]